MQGGSQIYALQLGPLGMGAPGAALSQPLGAKGAGSQGAAQQGGASAGDAAGGGAAQSQGKGAGAPSTGGLPGGALSRLAPGARQGGGAPILRGPQMSMGAASSAGATSDAAEEGGEAYGE